MAERSGIREVLQWFTREKQWVNDIHLQLCRVAAPTFLEQPRAEWMAAQFRALGWHAGIDSEATSWRRSTRTRRLAGSITAHLDTVLAPRIKEDIRWTGRRFPGTRGLRQWRRPGGPSGYCRAVKSVASSVRIINKHLAPAASDRQCGRGGRRKSARNPPHCPQTADRPDFGVSVLDGAALDHITTQALAAAVRSHILRAGRP